MAPRPFSPTSTPRSTAPRRRTTRCLAAATALAAAVVTAPTASAHDALTGSSPAAGATVKTAPTAIALTFNEGVLPLGTQIAVTGPGGAMTKEKTSVAGSSVSAPFHAAGNGAYTVTWRVTSEDGHPVSGSYRFTLDAATGAASPSSSAATQASSSPAALPSKPSTQSTVTGPSTPTRNEPGDNEPLLVIGGAIVAALALAGAFVVARRRVTDDPR